LSIWGGDLPITPSWMRSSPRPRFCTPSGKAGLNVIARLKSNLPELFAAAKQRFGAQFPHR
jgi:hypothetical protein